MSYLVSFSIPETVAPSLARDALELALTEFAKIDKGPHIAVRDQQFVLYRAYLGALGQVSIAQHIVAGISRSYLQFERAAMLSKAHRAPERHRVIFEKQVA